MNRLEQTITDLTQLMGDANMNHKEERNLLGDLPRGRLNLVPIIEFDEIPFYDGRFLKKKYIIWLIELKVYFYFNKIPYYKKEGLVKHKLSYYGVRE